MNRWVISAQFQRRYAAEEAAQILRSRGFSAAIREADSTETSNRETRFIGRIFLIIVFWSIIGTAAGAALGVILHLTIGPPGTEGLIIQVVTWAIFAHLIIGMWAGYALLADRTREDLPAVSARTTRLVVECDSIDGATRVAALLQEAGATAIETREAVGPAAER